MARKIHATPESGTGQGTAVFRNIRPNAGEKKFGRQRRKYNIVNQPAFSEQESLSKPISRLGLIM
jgi:hypothetical protein